MTDNEKIKDIITAAVMGDVTGYIFEGMNSKHIKAVFKDTYGIFDSAPALKNSLEKWKKPGFYSSISQLMLLTCSSVTERYLDRTKFIKTLASIPDLADLDYSFFRNPGLAERNFISGLGNNHEIFKHERFNKPCGRVILLTIPFLLIIADKQNVLDEIVRYISLYTFDSATIASSLMFFYMLQELMLQKSQNMMEVVLKSARESVDFIIKSQSLIFNAGMNPTYVVSEAEKVFELINEIKNIEDRHLCEKTICTFMNRTRNSPMARASVNHPTSLFVYGIFIASQSGKGRDVFHEASREGGSASALSAIAGAMWAACFGISIPEIYMKNLSNRKRLVTMIDMATKARNREKIINEMFETEPYLTLKEHEEYKSKNKRSTPKKKSDQSKLRREQEDTISKHVVESWTKIDKAKWKKEKKKHKS